MLLAPDLTITFLLQKLFNKHYINFLIDEIRYIWFIKKKKIDLLLCN